MESIYIKQNVDLRKRRQAGLSMVEVMIALGVLMVAVLGAFSSQAASSNLIRISREMDLAMADLQACMEQVLTLNTDDLPIEGSLFEEGQPVALYEGLNLEGESRSEEHTSELQSRRNLVCRLPLEKKKTTHPTPSIIGL